MNTLLFHRSKYSYKRQLIGIVALEKIFLLQGIGEDEIQP